MGYLAFGPQNWHVPHFVPSRFGIVPGLFEKYPSRHSRLQPDHLPIHSELAIPMMVDRLRKLLRRIRPGFDDFQDEEVEPDDETGTVLRPVGNAYNKVNS